MEKSDDYHLLIKYLSNETSEAENRQFAEWLKLSPENRKLFTECKDIYLAVGFKQTEGRYNEKKHWQAIESRISQFEKNRKNPFRIALPYLKIAAVVAIAFLLGFMAKQFVFSPKGAAPWYEIQASMGSTSRIQLADSSIVWLNAGSKLKLPPGFNQNSREVYLEGEAYFEVKKKQKQHFIVHASDIFIKVLGTHFNVKSYPEENVIETTLEEGSIQIYETSNPGKQPLILEPSQKATYIREKGAMLTSNIKSQVDNILNKKEIVEYRKANVIIASKVNTPDYTSWKEGQLIFKSEPLGEIFKILERKYNVAITSEDKQLNEFLITANFKNESIEQVMFALQLTSSFDFKIDKGHISINPGQSIRTK